MFPDSRPVVPGMRVRHDPEGGLEYRVDKVVPDTDDYENDSALNGLRRVAYTQLEDGDYPAGTGWDKDEAQFRANFTPLERGEIGPYGYRVVQGSNEPIRIVAGAIHKEQRRDSSKDSMPGVRHRGVYTTPHGDLEIVSFLYYKTDPATGKPETAERLVIQEGLGYGVHPGHVGQPPTWYIVGAQIGTVTKGEVNVGAWHNSSIDPKHFSMSCIVDNPICEPLLADPPRQ